MQESYYNLAKFTGKHVCWSLSFNNVVACNFILKESPTQVFSCEFCKIFKYTFFNEHIRWLLLSCTFLFKELPHTFYYKKTRAIISTRDIQVVESEFRILIVY